MFAVLSHIGTAPNMAAMPIQFEKNVINFLPLSGARQMFDPVHRLKYASLPPYYDQMRVIVPQIAKEKGYKKVCVLYQDDEFGLEMLRGTEAALKSLNLPLVEKTSFKRGATDFSSQMAKLAAAVRSRGHGHHHPRDRRGHDRSPQDRLQSDFPGLQCALARAGALAIEASARS